MPEHPFRYAMRIRQEKINKQNKDVDAKHIQRQTNYGTGYRSLHDLMRSPFYKTTSQTLENNRKKEYLQKQFNTTIDNLDDEKLDKFTKEL